jgi:hypothetical protein
MAIANDKDVKWDESNSETIEQIETHKDGHTTHEQIEELSALEATAASKAAWLISITVSLGGLLFGTSLKINPISSTTPPPPSFQANLNPQVMTLDTFPQCL